MTLPWSELILGGLLGGYAFSRIGLLLTGRWRGRRLPWVHAGSWAVNLLGHLAVWSGVGPLTPAGHHLTPLLLAAAAGVFAACQLGWWLGDRAREDAAGPGPRL